MSSFYFWHWRICVLMRLNKGAFSNCSGLTNVTMRNGVKSIGDDVFCGCEKLTSVNFDGTQKEWLNALIRSRSSNGIGSVSEDGPVTIFCSDGELKYRFY